MNQEEFLAGDNWIIFGQPPQGKAVTNRTWIGSLRGLHGKIDISSLEATGPSLRESDVDVLFTKARSPQGGTICILANLGEITPVLERAAKKLGVPTRRATPMETVNILAWASNVVATTRKMANTHAPADAQEDVDGEEEEGDLGAFNGDEETKEAVLERLERLAADWSEGAEANDRALVGELIKAINGNAHDCVGCAARMLECSPMDLAVILGVYSNPNELASFIEYVMPGDDMQGYGVGALALSFYALERSEVFEVVPTHQRGALVLAFHACRRALDRVGGGEHHLFGPKEQDLLRSAKVLVAIDDGSVICELLENLVTVDARKIASSLGAALQHIDQMTDRVAEAASMMAEVVRDQTAATPHAADGEHAALMLDKMQDAGRVTESHPRTTARRYFERACEEEWMEAPNVVLRELMDELAEEDELMK